MPDSRACEHDLPQNLVATTHAPPNASLEQHRLLSALDSFGILAFHRILSEAAVECFSEVISPGSEVLECEE